MKNRTLPILLKNQKIVLIGGGNVALHKAKVLAQNEIEFIVIAKKIKKPIKKLAHAVMKKKFKLKDIGNAQIIINATGSYRVTQKLLQYKERHNVLLNIVDKPEYCDFYFMALTKNRPLQIAVSSNGASPKTAQYFRDQCEALIPQEITPYLEKKQRQRTKRKKK